MKCTDKTIQELLPAYIEGSLDDGAKLQVRTHLGTCPDCRDELAILAMLSEEAVPDPGEAFWAQLPGKVEREVRAHRPVSRFDLTGLFDRLLLPRWAWATAAAVLIVTLTWFMVRPAPVEMAGVNGSVAGSEFEEGLIEAVDLADASPAELDAATQWAQNQLQPIGEALSEDNSEAAEQLTDELDRLSTSELDRVYEALKKKEQELKKRQQNRSTGKDLA